MTSKRAKSAIITVGAGRGFVMQGKLNRFVITAAHCLPFFPPCCSFSFTEERTYENLLGHIGVEPSVWAECLFVDPIADIAVLGSPDTQVLGKQADDVLCGAALRRRARHFRRRPGYHAGYVGIADSVVERLGDRGVLRRQLRGWSVIGRRRAAAAHPSFAGLAFGRI
jgi:hypothetical protein